MTKAASFFLALATIVAAGFGVSPAFACAIVPITCIGSDKACHPSRAQQLANERRWSGEATLQGAIEARKQLAAGKVDVAAELAELLVPNIRPIRILRSDCGIEGEADYGAGEETEDGLFQAVVAGSSLAGSSPDEFAGLLRAAVMDLSFGKACNEEFRQNFADHLRRTVETPYLREAWLFLIPRQHWSRYPRLMRFEGQARTPPVRWFLADQWLTEQVDRSLKHEKWGRSLTTAIDAFWAANGPRLSEDSSVCPLAVVESARNRQHLLEQMLAQHAARLRRSGH